MPALGCCASPVPALPQSECFCVQIVPKGVGEWEQSGKRHMVFPEEGLSSLSFDAQSVSGRQESFV